MVNIFIANLDWSITSEDLKTTFSSFGEVHYAHVVFEKDSKRSRGYGYVEMEDPTSAIAAISALNGIEINGRAIDVKIASPKTNRPKKEVKEEKKGDNKFFKKKPFGFKGERDNRQGGSKFGERKFGERKFDGDSNRERTAPERKFDGDSNRERTTPSSFEQKNDRVMRPRKRMNEGGAYEKVERSPKSNEENE